MRGFAHYLTMMNFWSKFKENIYKDFGDEYG